jgi:phage terminase large subunit
VNNLAFDILHVKSITQKGDQVYYDITVPTFHNYIANGIIHHNSGKSVDTFRCAAYRMTAEPGHNYLTVRKSAKSNGTSTLPLMRSCISDWNLWPVFEEQKTTQTITNKYNGNQMKFMGLDDVEKIKSITFDNGPLTDIIIEEATEITEQDFNQLNLRLRGLAKQPFQMTLMFNPVSDMHWMKKRFFDNPGEKRNQITIHESTYLNNRFLDAEYKNQLEQLKYEDRVYYEIYALGHWGSIGNLVFRNIEYSTCPYSLEDFDEILAGMDFGYNHYHAIELIGIKDGVKYSFDELYVNHMTNDEIIRENETKKVLDKFQRCTADSAEPKSIKDWQNAGYNINPAKKGPDSVRQQISWLNRGKWIIDPNRCPGLASETMSYKWKEDRDGNVLDEPVKFKDDGIAACRYAIEEKTEYDISVLDVL